MPKIEITERDLTSPGIISESTDIVFIPGFVNTDSDNLQGNSENILPADEPYLFKSVDEFITKCGNTPPIFANDQKYSDLLFDPKAKPEGDDPVFIKQNTPDPSYVMAKELLASGMNVLYQRINGDADEEALKYPKFSEYIKSNSYIFWLLSYWLTGNMKEI